VAAADIPVVAADMGRFLADAQQRLAGRELLLGLLAVLHDFHHEQRAADAPVGKTPWLHLPAQPLQRAIGKSKAVIVLGQGFAGEDAAMDVTGVLGVGPKLENRAAGDRLRGYARDPVVDEILGADGEIAHIAIEHRHRGRRGFDEVFERPRGQI
jgi:hypothetical protein